MAYCRYCGAEVRSSDAFCFKCGKTLEIQSSIPALSDRGEEISPVGAGAADTQVRQMNVIIDPARIVVVGILSFGTYFFYWFYLTWKHYRNYTRTENYPVWHAFTLFVPIYFLFRIHAHIRSYKELMTKSGIASSLSPGLFVVLVLFSNLLSLISLGSSFWGSFFNGSSYGITGLDIAVIGLDIGILVWVQTNLNRYWRTIKDVHATNARIGVGEVIFILLGILAWLGTFLPPN